MLGPSVRLLSGFVALLLVTAETSAIAESTRYGVSDDLWDVSQGSVVTGDSGMLSLSFPESIFGYENALNPYPDPYEKYNAIFRYASTGTIHWVEWETPTPITLRSFMLGSNGDGTSDDRRFSRFTLYAANMVSGAFDIKLFELFPANPYGDTVYPANAFPQYDPQPGAIFMFANVTPTTAQQFRAEFVAVTRWAPRVNELDGFDTFFEPIPEPSSLVAILGMGVIALLAFVRKRGRRGAAA